LEIDGSDKPPQGLSGECLRTLFELRPRIPFGDSMVRLNSWKHPLWMAIGPGSSVEVEQEE
jgi:hypothetical protein